MTSPRVVVIGAGFGGLGAAIELRRHGVTDVTILERADDVGGVWRDNTYPGAACDVPSLALLLVLRAEPGLVAPLLRPARDPRLHRAHRRPSTGCSTLVRTGTEVTGATFDEDGAPGTVDDHGRRDVRRRRPRRRRRPALASRSCPRSPARTASPAPPSTPPSGATTSTCAASGSPSSAPAPARSSSCPGIVAEVGAMTVFQRSAPYVVPKPDRAYTRSCTTGASPRFPRTPGVRRAS